MTVRDIIYLCTAAGTMLAVGFKLRSLRHRRVTPQLWALCASIFLSATIWWAASPTTIRLLNRATGITNFTAPFVYCLAAAFAGSVLVLALFWRYPEAVAWPWARIVIAAYGLAIGAIIWLFSVSDVPEERLIDFETYYAGQPTVAGLLMIYVIAGAVGAGIVTYGCFSWARSGDYDDRPWLRRGLRLYGTAAAAAFVSHVEKLLAVGSAIAGLHWLDTFNVLIPIVVAPLSVLCVLAAVVLPIWGPRVPALRMWMRRWRAFWTLRPLHRALRRVDPSVVFLAPGKRFDVYHRVRRQLTELNDFRLRLEDRFDPAVEATARRLAQQAALPAEQVRASVEAAQLKAAQRSGADGAVVGTCDPGGGDSAEDGADVEGELTRWLRVAKAYTGSPVVAAAIAETSSPKVVR